MFLLNADYAPRQGVGYCRRFGLLGTGILACESGHGAKSSHQARDPGCAGGSEQMRPLHRRPPWALDHVGASAGRVRHGSGLRGGR